MSDLNSAEKPVTILCLASYFKGTTFLTAAKAAGCRVIALYDDAGAQERSRAKVICDYYAGGFGALLED